MRSKNVLAWLGAVGAALLVACSSVSPTEACADLSNAVCNKAAECASPTLSVIYGDVTTCASRAAASCEKSLALKDTVDTPDFAEKCSQTYATSSCGDVVDNNPAPDCKRTKFGLIADGSVCGTAGQCASGVCQIDGTTGCGKCVEPAPNGQACQSTSDCQSGLVCAATTTGAACIAPAASGATCSTTAPIIPCQQGLICNGTTCQAPLAAGSACDATPGKSLCDGANGYWCTPKGTRCVSVKFAPAGKACGYDQTTGDLTVCTGGGAGGAALGACQNIDQQTLQGTCAAAAADGATCDAAKGPYCTPPALCIGGACTVVDPATCK